MSRRRKVYKKEEKVDSRYGSPAGGAFDLYSNEAR